MKRRERSFVVIDFVVVLISGLVFASPFYFIILNAGKSRQEASLMNLEMPEQFLLWDNLMQVFQESDYMVIRSFLNSTLITAGALLLLVLICSMGGYVLQRRRGRGMTFLNLLFLSGLMLPTAVLPTIWVMQTIGVYRSKTGMVLVEAALNIPFTIMLYRGFMHSVPQEIEEAAFVDGCGPLRMFVQIVFPLLKPVTATVVVLNAVTIFNDFVNPLYFLPGSENPTIQLTLYNFMGRFSSQWNLLFADVLLITVPPFLLFIFFNRRIVDGMAAGAVKG